MKNIALFLGIVCVGLFVFFEAANKKKLLLYHDHEHEFEQDSEDVWWG